MNIQYLLAISVRLFHTPYDHSLSTNNNPIHRLTILINTAHIGWTSMLQSFMKSMIKMKPKNCWEMEDPNWDYRVLLSVNNRNVFCFIIYSIIRKKGYALWCQRCKYTYIDRIEKILSNTKRSNSLYNTIIHKNQLWNWMDIW